MKPNWKCVVSYKTELLTESLIHKGYREDLLRLLPELGLLRNRMIVDNDIYVDLNEVAQIHERLSSDFIVLAKKTYAVIERESENFLGVCQDVARDVSEKSNGELLNEFISFSNAYKSVISMIGIPTSIDLYFEEALLKGLSNYFQDPHAELLKCFVSKKRSLTNLAHEELLKMGVKKKEGGDITPDVEDFQRKYGWVNCTLFMGMPLSLQQVEEEVSKIKEPENELNALTSEYKIKIHEREELLSKISDDMGLSELVTFFGETVYYRTARLEWMNSGCFFARPLIEEIAKRMGESFDVCIYYTFDEVVQFFKGGIKVGSDEINERVKGYAYISDDSSEYHLLTGNELASFKSLISETHEKDLECAVIKGTTASGGLVKGTVKIVRDRSEMDKVQDGDVLVTPLTTPDFLMAMKKSVAIVTDLGGVTSHAAITARELKIPCIIGTKIATQVLKDGDLVEVDADNGVVRVLERVKN